MPSTTKVDNVEIPTPLSDVQDAATTLTRTFYPFSLLSSIPDTRHRRTRNWTQTNMNFVQLHIAKESNDRLQLWMDASSNVLKCAVIKSLGEAVHQIITVKTSRFQQIMVAEIIARVRTRFGKLQKDTKTAVEDLDKQIAALTKFFNISEMAGLVVDEDHKVDYFRDSLFGHPILAEILKQFDFEFPDSILIMQVTAYVVLHLPNLKTAKQASTRMQANTVTSDAYAALQLETKQLRDDVQELKRT